MSEAAWEPGTATAIGSMPGTDPVEAARTVVGELPELMPFPELPARGVGADLIGRTAGMLVGDLAVEVVPSGYRVAGRPGHDQQRAVDLLRWDLDAVEQAAAEAGAPRVVKVQAAGPWTLAAGIELMRGHRVLTDHGALRDFTESLTEGLTEHAGQVAARTGARVVVQLDEPSLPAVLNGRLPTPSGYGTVPAVPAPDAQRRLAEVIETLAAATGSPVVVHCCARRPPVALLRRAGAGAIALDATGLGDVTGEFADELGETWEEGTTLFLGLVPSRETETTLRQVAQPAFDLATRLGFSRRTLAERGVPTPTCGFAGASPAWARRAIGLTRDLARMFADEAEG
ncbi:cobalamin-independent methionine synthase catalytic subunit [Saccharopolyspora erythraea NRRL 2338]|uniref:Methionine synthase, vitamin-B12 independent n=2 Tax=Saccharopolyspora erythraea TaxID=1836 RepID=A4FMT0_SACEN|nr:methionine synthase [Saccharopolyspora erythraea]EQD81990.1 methionine synthase [Saccharopolyspora erythraea D]PFG99000.1 cobalamin-independent methionine synthase catalytic subunit [Saccharopolyspora erythraea NRRL 2338]QRK88971.1 methionine synthase [Saccharopolyspora erythraea]CAM05355.1 methionine synthase, vitamin-B12 independent [Saccharopolyspora erythraea NRRL 2338]